MDRPLPWHDSPICDCGGPRQHLESIDPGLVGDWLERAAIRMESGQNEAAAMREAYIETCKRVGAEPMPPKATP